MKTELTEKVETTEQLQLKPFFRFARKKKLDPIRPKELHQEIQPKLEVKQELHQVDSSSSDIDGPPSKKRKKKYGALLRDGYEVFGSST